MAQLHFCEICEVSIPDKDLEDSLAIDLHGKAICHACLAKVFTKVPNAVSGTPSKAGSDRSLPFFFAFSLLLLCFMAGFWYLNSRMGEGFRAQAKVQEKLAGSMAAFEDLLRAPKNKAESSSPKDLARLQKTMREIQGTLSVLSVHIKKKGSSKSSSSEGLDSQLRDLVQRQSALERGVFGLERKLTAALNGVSKELIALRRKSLSIPSSSGAGGSKLVAADLPEKLGPFVDDLEDAEVSKRWTAVDELIGSGDKRVVPYLLPRLKDRDVYIRRHCAKGLGKLGDKKAVPALLDALEDPEAVVRQAVLKSLQQLAGRTFAFDPESNVANRKRALKVIRGWWAKHK